jgi:microcystin-dependent protein
MQVADPAAPQDVSSKAYVDAWAVPTGTIVPFAGSSAPSGFYIADGSLKSRTTDAALFAIIGTTYGVGDGSTTFGLPNLLGKVVVAMDAAETEFNALGKTGGEKTHILLSSEMPSHSHTATVTDPQHSHGAGTFAVFQSTVAGGNVSGRASNVNTQGTVTGLAVNGTSATSVTGVTVANANTGGDGAHNNLPPYISMPYIIKR